MIDYRRKYFIDTRTRSLSSIVQKSHTYVSKASFEETSKNSDTLSTISKASQAVIMITVAKFRYISKSLTST